MVRQMLLLLISFSMLSQNILSGQTNQLPIYGDATAYEVYSAVLSSQYSGSVNLIISLETGRTFGLVNETDDEPRICLRPDAESEKIFGTAIADFIKVNKTKWQLQEKFKLKTPYQLVSSDVINSIFRTTGLKGFREKYSSSSVWIGLSAVGFNAEKTVAVVYMEKQSGRDGAEYLVFHKKDGKWIPLEWKGESCYWVSWNKTLLSRGF